MAAHELKEGPFLVSPAPVRAAFPQESPMKDRPPSRFGISLLLALVMAGLLWLSYFPIACGWLAWVALVPFLALVRSPARPRQLYLCAWLGAFAFYLAALQWLRVADERMYFTWIGLAIWCALYYPLALYLTRRLEQYTSWPLLLTFPAVWVALEYVRMHLFDGFGWYLLGHSQQRFLHLIQISDITGAYGVSFLVAAGNVLVFEALWGRAWFRRWTAGELAGPRWSRAALAGQGLVLLLTLTAAVAYGSWRLGQDTGAPGPRVALLQGNVPQQLRNASSAPGAMQDIIQQVKGHFMYLCDMAAAYQPDLIVWPETSFPYEWTEVSADLPQKAVPEKWRELHQTGREFTHDAAGLWQAPLLLGMNTRILEADGEVHRYNSAVLVDRHGEVAGRYHKIHCVPFGEYIPLRDWLPWLKRFAPYDWEYSVTPGRQYTRFTLPERKNPARAHRFGVLICIEDTDPAVSRPYGGSDGARPTDFLLNISNDGWFDGTSEHDEHLAICRFRAIESRRSVARAVNMGITALIDSNGRVVRPITIPRPEHLALCGTVAPTGTLAALPWMQLAHAQTVAPVWCVPDATDQQRELPLEEWKQFKKRAGILLARIPIDQRGSVYAVLGSWLPWSCWALIGAGWLLGWLRPRGAGAP
jgi:apolipoprotein N-acyltransferase